MCFAVYKFYPHKAIYWSLWNLRSGSLRSWDWLLENSRVIVLKSYLCLLPRQSQILVSANFSYLLVFLTIVTHLKYCYNVCYKKQLQHWHDAWNFPSSCFLAIPQWHNALPGAISLGCAICDCHIRVDWFVICCWIWLFYLLNLIHSR